MNRVPRGVDKVRRARLGHHTGGKGASGDEAEPDHVSVDT